MIDKGLSSPAFPNLKVVTVNFNLKHDTVTCIQSLLKSGAVLDQLVVVDNASIDDPKEILRENFGENLAVLTSSENHGYAHGLNLGIKYSLAQQNIEWILLINNDTTFSENFLQEMKEAAFAGQYKLFGPAIFYMNDPQKILGFGDRLIPGTFITRRLYRNQKLPENLREKVQVDFLNGCAMLVHRLVFDRIGLFDESYFMYAEEVDFCWRARTAGFRMAVVPTAKMWHKVSASSPVREPALFMQIRSQVIFYRRYSRGLKKILMFLFSFFRSGFVSVRFLFMGKINFVITVFRGWKTGWFE